VPRTVEFRLTVAGAAVVGVAYGMGRFAFGLTLPSLRTDPALSATGVDDAALGLLAAGSFAGYLAGIVLAPLLARRHGPRAPTTLGGLCGVVGAVLVAFAPSVAVLAVGAVVGGSAAGWVWAPYSDLAAALLDPPRRPRVLAIVNTGTSAGLVVVGAVGLVAAGVPGWRVVWVAVALASAAAAALNLAWTPRVAPAARTRSSATRSGAPLGLRLLVVPSVYAVVYYVGTTTFFTWAADALRRAGLPAGAGGVLFVIVGLTGLVALGAGGTATRWGPHRLAAVCLVSVAVALTALGLGAGSWVVALGAAVVFGPGYMTGAAVMAVWTAVLVPDRPGEALTVVVAVAATAAVVAPAVIGVLIGVIGLPAVLVGLAVLLVLVAAGLVAPTRRARR
jgi:predicted MFS family arabinose efflux permease